MSDLISPDIPAHYSYAVVLFFGAIVAYQTVNHRLGDQRDRWAFADAWLVVFTYVTMPVVLFWFLDFTSALHDTSLFAALVVAFGFRQVFAGGVPGIKMSGQTGALWKPFDAWVTQIVDRIATRNKLYADRFDDKVRSLIAGDPKRMATFKTLALVKSTKRSELQKDLIGLATTGDADADTRIKLDLLWRDFRRSEPDLYGWLLYKRGVVGGLRYWMWLDNGRSKITLFVVFTLVFVALATLLLWFTSGPAGTTRVENASLQYHRWRFLKGNTTDRDRWRTREYLVHELRGFGTKPIKTVDEARADVEQAEKALSMARDDLKRVTPKTAEWSATNARIDASAQKVLTETAEQRRATTARGLLSALVHELGYPSIPADQAAAILGLLVDTRSPALNAVYIPELIQNLRGQNQTVRLETRKTLLALQKADYAGVPLPDEVAKWEPKKDESAADVDQRIRRCHEWWRIAQSKYPVTGNANGPRS